MFYLASKAEELSDVRYAQKSITCPCTVDDHIGTFVKGNARVSWHELEDKGMLLLQGERCRSRVFELVLWVFGGSYLKLNRDWVVSR
jgi:hypothetical protein